MTTRYVHKAIWSSPNQPRGSTRYERWKLASWASSELVSLTAFKSGPYARFHALQQLGPGIPAGSAPLQHLTATGSRHCDGFEQVGGGAVAAALGSVVPLLHEGPR